MKIRENFGNLSHKIYENESKVKVKLKSKLSVNRKYFENLNEALGVSNCAV